MDEIVEQWRPVVGYEGFYEVSDQGRVRSVDREVLGSSGVTRFLRGRVLRAIPLPNGYLKVNLFKSGKSITRTVHSVVLAAFIGPRLEGTEACHNDGDVTNNKLSNLRWDTHVANLRDKLKHGTHNRGEQNACANLTAMDVINIRREYEECRGKYGTVAKMAKRYGVSHGSVWCVVNRQTWKHV